MTEKIMEKIKDCDAFLFDKDGTLIDFNYLWLNWSVVAARFISRYISSLQEEDVLSQWGVKASEDTVDSEGPMAVGSLNDIIVSAAALIYRHNHLWPEARQLAVDAVDHSWKTVSKEKYTRAIKGIPEMIKRLKEEGKKLAVVTTDETESAYQDIGLIGLEGYFDVILGCDMVERCKPFPDLVLKVCSKMGISPENAVVIGDTRADMLMGKNAGVSLCVGVTSGLGSAEKLGQDADFLLNSAAGLMAR